MTDTHRLCLIGADNAMLDDNFTGDPDTLEPGQRLVVAATNMDDPDGLQWSQAKNGWELKIPPAVLISIAAFMLLFTPAEWIAIKAARSTDVTLDYYWELMMACTGGLSLQHPVVIAGIQHLVDVNLIASARQTQILAGEAP